jgi:MFS family permease
MSSSLPNARSHITLFLCTLLHAFTHALATLLVPLYLLVVEDLNLSGVKMASLLVTVYGVTYALLSYPSGILADRLSRKQLLGWGLIANAVAVGLMGLTRQYEWLVVLAVVAGFAGTLFHPAVATLGPAHYPKSPGMAIGIVGMGAGLGFFAGPQFAGWRAQSATWQWHNIADWQRPCVEMAIAGIVVGIVFLLLATDLPRSVDPGKRKHRVPMPKGMRRRLLAIAAVLCCRDFSGLAAITLASLYLQTALGKSPKETGFIIGTMMLLSIVINPLSVWVTQGRRRLIGLSVILLCGGAAIASTPLWPAKHVLAALTLVQCFHLGSYSVSDASLLERVSPDVRGRVIGFFLTIAGTFGGWSAWAMGYWVDHLGERASHPSGYLAPFATLGAMMAISSMASPLIARLGEATRSINPLTEVDPRTLETVG